MTLGPAEPGDGSLLPRGGNTEACGWSRKGYQAMSLLGQIRRKEIQVASLPSGTLNQLVLFR
jgi:hypothetical protein